MTNEQWLNNLDRFRFLSWLIAIGILIGGFPLASWINGIVYASENPESGFTIICNFAIVILGYSWWSAHIASTVIALIVGEIFKALIKLPIRLIQAMISLPFNQKRGKKPKSQKMSAKALSHERDEKLIRTIRKGTTSFYKAGLISGCLLGILNVVFIEPSLGGKGFIIYLIYGYAWGYLWYRLAWFGIVPLPPEEIEVG